MKELKVILDGLGCSEVSTYIQSGNVVLRHEVLQASKLSQLIRQAVYDRCHFEPQVLLMSVKKLQDALRANPFAAATEKPQSLHLYFLSAIPTGVDRVALKKLSSAREEYELIGEVFYLHAPDGIGRSKLAARVEKLLGVSATARNWRTVHKVLELTA